MNGAKIGITIPTKAHRRTAVRGCRPQAPPALFAEGRGTATLGTAGWRIASTAHPVFAAASWAFGWPGQNNPLVLLPSYPLQQEKAGRMARLF